MAAMTIDQHAAHAHLPHFAKGDLDGATVNVRTRVASDRTRHAAIETRRRPESNCRLLVSRNERELLPVVAVQDSGRAILDARGAHTIYPDRQCDQTGDRDHHHQAKRPAR